jgi:hypothetical protein
MLTIAKLEKTMKPVESQSFQFEDTDDFYRQLRTALSTGTEVTIETSFTKLDELPTRLDTLCRGAKLRAAWSGPLAAGATFHAGWTPDLRSLYVLGGAAAGAFVGTLVGGPVGTAVGATIGTAAGAVAGLVTEDSYELVFEVDSRGRLRIRIRKGRR